MKKDDSAVSPAQEQYILQTFSYIHKIIFRKLGAFHRDSLEDLKQRVFLKLWRWKIRQSERNLSDEEWQKMAHVVARNEVTDFFRKKDNRHILFSQMDESVKEEVFSVASPETVAGNSETEIKSLLHLIWKLAQELSLRQKYAYFLQYPSFIVEFVAAGCCSIKELAIYLEVSRQELSEIIDSLPFSDEEIGELLERKLGGRQKISRKKIWEARAKAKAKLAGRLKEFIPNVRLFVRRRP